MSCDAQFKVCLVFAASMQRDGWQLVDRHYDDLGHSSETLDRPALNRLVEDIQAGEIDRVLVHRLDRVARKLVFACQFLELLRQHDVATTIVRPAGDSRRCGGSPAYQPHSDVC
jgi:site-specific DNA recombinase